MADESNEGKIVLNVPPFFWYAVSVCMLAVTAAFAYAGFKGAGMDIEIANMKISLSEKIEDTQDIAENTKRDLIDARNMIAELKQNNDELEAQNEELIAKIEAHNSQKNTAAAKRITIKPRTIRKVDVSVKELDERINEIEAKNHELKQLKTELYRNRSVEGTNPR